MALVTVSPHLFAFLHSDQQDLVRDTLTLLSWAESSDNRLDIHDYAFLVFPLAKAYEGFLKDYFLKTGLIDQKQYESRNFRIGRSFNPDLPYKFRDEYWFYDKVAESCSPTVAKNLWHAWLEGRNHLFHYYPGDRYDLNLSQAESRIRQLLQAMEDAILCKPTTLV